MENKLKHLDYLQDTIKRMARNSFALKGWAITLVSSIFVLISRSVDAWYFYLLALIPILMFWGLDAYYLKLEREYRVLYDIVRKMNEENIDFSMKITIEKNDWLRSVFSRTEVAFYGATLLISILVAVLINSLGM